MLSLNSCIKKLNLIFQSVLNLYSLDLLEFFNLMAVQRDTLLVHEDE